MARRPRPCLTTIIAVMAMIDVFPPNRLTYVLSGILPCVCELASIRGHICFCYRSQNIVRPLSCCGRWHNSNDSNDICFFNDVFLPTYICFPFADTSVFAIEAKTWSTIEGVRTSMILADPPGAGWGVKHPPCCVSHTILPPRRIATEPPTTPAPAY